MQESVAPGHDTNEGSEFRHVDNTAGVDGPHFSRRGIQDQRDAASRLFDGATILCADRNGSHDTVVIYRNICTGLLLEGIDDLALWTYDLANFVNRDF